MSLPPPADVLEETLRVVARRYRLPPMAAALPRIDTASAEVRETSPRTALAIAIEQARRAVARGVAPDAELQRLFTHALARMIDEAMRVDSGDPAFQAMVLRHHAPQVREYASLSAHANRDRRLIHAKVNAIAHPAKQQRRAPGWQREALAQLHASAPSAVPVFPASHASASHASASPASWSTFHDTAHGLWRLPEMAGESILERSLSQILASPALGRLRRLESLASDEHVRRYQALWDRQGPRSRSAAALAQGTSSRQRGAAVEALSARALDALARRLNEAEGSGTPGTPYRVVTSMHAPASIPASPDGAKTEWDVVLLRHAETVERTPVWDIRLLVEAKASVDAATSDLPRLLRGLRLLAHAEASAMYSFDTRQGAIRLRGASLRALGGKETSLSKIVLYCCDAPVEGTGRLLSAASRMQLLSAQASLEFAGMSADARHANPDALDTVWHQLLEAPRWSAVLHQYPMLRQVRELMVHTDDLREAIEGAGRHH